MLLSRYAGYETFCHLAVYTSARESTKDTCDLLSRYVCTRWSTDGIVSMISDCLQSMLRWIYSPPDSGQIYRYETTRALAFHSKEAKQILKDKNVFPREGFL